jgi:hypothetical protein
MSTMEQDKRGTGLDIEVHLPTEGHPLEGTIAQIVEGPYREVYDNMGKRVTVKGQKTYIEVPPQDDWFEMRTLRGREMVYLKFHCTGLEMIYYGPYETKEDALLGLNKIHNHISEALMNG